MQQKRFVCTSRLVMRGLTHLRVEILINFTASSRAFLSIADFFSPCKYMAVKNRITLGVQGLICAKVAVIINFFFFFA